MSESAPTSRLPRLQHLIDLATPNGSPSSVVVPLSVVEEMPGGLRGLQAFFEGPSQGRFFRLESPTDPVLIFEVGQRELIIRAADDPTPYIGCDPRTDLILPDGGLTEWSAGTVLGRISPCPEELVDDLRGWVNRYGLKGALVKGEPGEVCELTVPVHAGAQRELRALAAKHGATAEVGTYDQGTGLRWDALSEVSHDVLKRRPEPGRGAHRVHGGIRFEIGKRKKRKPNYNRDVSIQNRLNSKRGLAKRVAAARRWHKSFKGKQLHTALARYNKGNTRREMGEAKISDEARRFIEAKIRSLVHQGMSPKDAIGPAYQAAKEKGFDVPLNEALWEEQGPEVQSVDDAFDALLRKLITIESLDVLQDVEFDDAGAIYLFFDPSLTFTEMEEILHTLAQENNAVQLVGSSDKSLPGEQVESDWWVIFAPYREAADGTLVPDPQRWAAEPSVAKGAPAPQTLVVPALTTVDKVAATIDTGALMQALSEQRQPVVVLWSDPTHRTPKLKGFASGAVRQALPDLCERAARGEGHLFLIRARDVQAARAIMRDRLLEAGPSIWTNTRELHA